MTNEVNNKDKQVATKQNTDLSADFVNQFDGMDMGAGENIDNDDIIISKIHLAQALTPEVSAGVIQAGHYMDSASRDYINDTVDVLIFGVTKLWQVFKEVTVQKGKKTETKLQYLETIDYDDSLDIDEECADGNIHRDRLLRFIVLRVDELKNGMASPYYVDFKRTSYQAGRQLQTKFSKMRNIKLPSFAYVFTLSSDFVQEEHDYYVKKVSSGRKITPEELEQIGYWLNEMKNNAQKYKADESDIVDDTQTFETTATPSDVNQGDKPKF
jgi:hypothetical protein